MIAAGTFSKAVEGDLHAILGVLVILCSAVVALQVRSKAAVSAMMFALAGGLRVMAVAPAAVSQIAHAILAQGLLASAFLTALETAPGWSSRSHLQDGGFPSLRQLAWLTPAVTLIQIVLGAAYRRELAGVLPHVSWAFATAICVMMAGAFVLTQKESGPLLRSVSLWLLCLTGVQLLLGVGAYLAKVNPGDGWLALSSTIHIATGSVVMALSTVWSAIVWRDTSQAVHALSMNSGRQS